MILRRFTQHIKQQNWFAVGLDVIVVVVGIFLGMQVTEWYEERNQIEALERSLDRVLVEAEENILGLTAYLEEYSLRNQLVEENFRVLLSCSTDQDEINKFKTSLRLITGTRKPRMQSDALVDVTEKDRYTNIMKDDLLGQLNKYKRRVFHILNEVGGNDNIVWKNIPYRTDAIKIITSNSDTYASTQYGLNMSFEDVCKHNEFIKAILDYGFVLKLNVDYAAELLDKTQLLIENLKKRG